MRKFKILNILSSVILFTYIVNIKSFALNRNNVVSNVNRKQEVEIKGLNFKKISFDEETKESVYYNEKYNIIIASGVKSDNNQKIGHISFQMGLEDDEGGPHALEHELYSEQLFKNENKTKKWIGISTSSGNSYSGSNAYTYNLLDSVGNVQFELDKKLFEKGNEKEFLKLVNIFLGRAKFLTDKQEIYKREIKNKMNGKIVSRILHELLKKESKIEKGMKTRADDIFYAGGKYKEMKKTTFKKLKDLYFKYVVNGMPCLFFQVENLEQAKRPVGLFKEHYFEKKENYNISDQGKNKKIEFFTKGKLYEGIQDQSFKYLEEKGNQPKEKIAKYVCEETYKIEDFDEMKNGCFTFLDIDNFLKKAIDIKKYGFEKIEVNVEEEGNFILKIFGDDGKLFEKDVIEEKLKKIKEEILKFIESNKITLEDMVKGNRKKYLEENIEKRKINAIIIYNKILKSLVETKTPFSKKYFTLDRNKRILNDYKEYEKNFEENCNSLIENTLKEKPEKIRVYENVIKKHNKDEEIEEIQRKKLPYKISSDNVVESIIAEEIIIEKLLRDLSRKGLIYCSVCSSYVLNEHGHPLFDSEIEIIKSFFKKEFKGLLKNLKLEDSYIKDKVEIYKNISKQEQNNLNMLESKHKNIVNVLENILKEKRLNTEKIKSLIEEIEKFKYDFLNETVMVIKLQKKDYEKLEKIQKDSDKNMGDIFRYYYTYCKKSTDKKLDEKINKEYFKILKKQMNLEKGLLKYIKILKLKNKSQIEKAKNLKIENIKKTLKNVVVEDFDVVNRKTN